jgi:hypothetical protein
MRIGGRTMTAPISEVAPRSKGGRLPYYSHNCQMHHKTNQTQAIVADPMDRR